LAEEKKWWDGDKKLRTTGELVSDGGLSGAVMSILYLIIGIAVWGGIGYLGDLVFSTTWLGWVGVGRVRCCGPVSRRAVRVD